jgi:hypothetical protein
MRPRSFVFVVAIVACGSAGGGTIGTYGPEPPSFDAGSSTSSSGALAPFDAGTQGPPPCKPLGCAEQGIECGAAGDGCGGFVSDCGTCALGLSCGGPGAPSKCVSPNVGGCFPKTCSEQGTACGPALDGCGGIITDCGACDGGTQCGSAGVHSQCVMPDEPCMPKTCASIFFECGQAPNGCGGLTPVCGDCAPGSICKFGQCVKTCAPRSCTEAGAQCGYVADGCGGLLDCGVCPELFTCGYGGRPYKCGAP